MKSEVVRSLCGFCHANCGVRMYLRDGHVARVDGDRDHPVNRGYLCSKAKGIKAQLESKDRLTVPMKKTKGGFAAVSWDEALDIAADRLSAVREEYGAEALFHCHGAPVTYGARDGFLQFMGAYGSPNYTGAANTCFVPRLVAFVQSFGGRPEPDYDNTKLAIFWASNPLNSTRFCCYAAYDGFHNLIPRLKEKGVRLVAIDAMRSETACAVDDWIRPKIGTDTALALAMAHVIIEEKLFDAAFVEKWVAGFDEIGRHVAPASPEWAEAITSVPAGAIRRLARAYAGADGAIIVDGNGLDMQTGGVDMVRAVCLLIALTGNIDKPGGNVFYSFAGQRSLPTIRPEKVRFGKDQFPLFPQTPFPAFKEAVLKGAPGAPRAMIVHHANPVLIQGNQGRTRDALQKLDFLMVADIFPTATTQIADLVLPVASDHEMVDFRAYSSAKGGFVALREKVAEPAGQARSVFEVEYEIARRMGMGGDYPFHDAEGWLDFVLAPSGVTLARLRQEHIVYASPPVVYRKYEKAGFNTPSKKVECFSERFHAAGSGALPAYQAPAGSDATGHAEYRLSGTTRRPAEYIHTKLRNLPPVRKTYPDPLVRLHAEDAAERGVLPDDLVEVRSPRGRIELRAMITDDVTPGLVAIDFGWGNPTDGKAAMNVLTADDVWDRVSGGYPNRLFRCEIRKLG